MQYYELGHTGIRVSQLCFGALTVGPLQAKLPLHEGAAVIRAALDAGVTFIDTAELYNTYDHVKVGIGGASDIVIASKSYAWSYEGMQDSIDNACRQLGRDYIDIFMLHEQTSRLTMKGHADALRCLADNKQRGRIRAAGVSTHTVEVVRAAALATDVDVIHPILNKSGIGIVDGSVDDMLAAIEFAAAQGKGIYTMKALGGGHLIRHAEDVLRWILQQSHIASVAVGMRTVDEVTFNTSVFKGLRIDGELKKRVAVQSRSLIVEEWCIRCGNCIRKCPMQAMRLEEGQVRPDRQKCILCGYCGAFCPEFALKIV